MHRSRDEGGHGLTAKMARSPAFIYGVDLKMTVRRDPFADRVHVHKAEEEVAEPEDLRFKEGYSSVVRMGDTAGTVLPVNIE